MNVLRVPFVGLVLLIGAATAAPAQTTAQNGEAEQVKARQKIFMMEGVLERAVQVGIDSFRRKLSAAMPDDMLLVTGDGPQARGFRLDGYGVFFDVEVPGVRPSLAWSLRTMNETAAIFNRDLARMRAQIQQAVSNPQQRAEMEQQLARLQQLVVPQPVASAPPGIGAAPLSNDARATVAAQSIERGVAVGSAAPPVVASSPAAAIDPGEVFTKEVATALIDAMLENSGSLIIAAEEWLTVAARDNTQGSRFVASDPSDLTTVVLRVKGSDLAAFQARRLTPDEVRKRVEVRAF
jgi:hypothetical protein